MTLYDTNSLAIETNEPSPTLPDPATVSGRTHDLTSTSSSATVWGSTGATPFQVDGANVATLTVPRGATRRVQSDGTRWVLIRTEGRRIVATKGVTDSNGQVTFTFNPPFATTPVVTNAVETSNSDTTECRITALSPSSVTFTARRSPTVTVLTFQVLAQSVPLVGATVHAIAAETG